jgi:glycosyltransferase involved in cell wall biosynthesis
VSRTAADYVCKHYPAAKTKAIEVIPRGVDPNELDRSDAQLEQGRADLYQEFPQLHGRVCLLLPGRGTRLKGHQQALELLAALRQRLPTAMLFFAGIMEAHRSNYVGELKRQAQALGIQDRVIFSASRSDLPVLYRCADVVLQLSNRPESFGRTVAESLYCGTPVAGLDIGGVGEQLRAHFPQGLLAAEQPSSWPGIVEGLLQRPEIKRDRIVRLAQMQAQTLALYRALLKPVAKD